MRNPILALVLLSAACTSENELRYTATLRADTNGVALSDDGLDAYAAMSGTTCRIDTSWGCPTSDADLPTDHERVVDHWKGVTLGATEQGVHTILGQAWLQEVDLEIAEVHSARLTDAGTLVVAGNEGDCVLSDDDGSMAVPGVVCSDLVVTDVDREDGSLVAATSEGVFRLSAARVDRLADAADLVATDAHTGMVIFGNRGDVDVFAVDRAGEPVWTVRIEEPLQSIAVRGDRGELLLLVGDGAFGHVERRDLTSGELESSSSVPSTEGDLVVSGNGNTVGIVRPTEVHWYSLLLADEEPVVDENVETCMDAWDRASRD
ncbi:MAG: hypothetical protein R3F61_00435 [Myxococcota bacterium]